jgi:hypothetical protein
LLNYNNLSIYLRGGALEKYIGFERKNNREGFFTEHAYIGAQYSFVHRGALLRDLRMVYRQYVK